MMDMMNTVVVVSQSETPDCEYAFANARKRDALDPLTEHLEAQGFAVSIKAKCDQGITLYFLTASRPKTQVKH